MKRKQKDPRRTRPVDTFDEFDKEPLENFDPTNVGDEPELKNLKVDVDTAKDSSDWKWNISDFRKDYSEHSKELSKDLKETVKQLEHLPNDSKEHLKQLEQLPNDSKEPSNNSKVSSNSSNEVEHLEECVSDITESSESSKESVNISKEDEGCLKESHLKNPPQVVRSQTEGAEKWKIPVRNLKEPVNPENIHSPSLNANLIRSERNEEIANFIRFETPNDNMPVILNVFSLAKDATPAKQLIANTKQENSILFTPPCSPPLVQLGAFNATPVQNPRFRYDYVNQTGFQQRNSGKTRFTMSKQARENWYKPVQRVHYNSQTYFSYPAQQVSYNPKEYRNNHAQQVYCTQEYLSKPVQQVGSHEYVNKPVKQVYYYPQEYFPKPAQQVNSQGYLNNPVQQAAHHREYSSNPVQPVTRPQEYISNPVQQVNPQTEYRYNQVQPVNYNPQQIANGVLPIENQPSHQAIYETQGQITAAQYQYQASYNHVNQQQPTSQLKTILPQPENYRLVKKGQSVTKGNNGMYSRFRIRMDRANMENIGKSPTATNPYQQFFVDPATAQIGSNVNYAGIHPQSVRSQASVPSMVAGDMFANTASISASQNEPNTNAMYSGVPASQSVLSQDSLPTMLAGDMFANTASSQIAPNTSVMYSGVDPQSVRIQASLPTMVAGDMFANSASIQPHGENGGNGPHSFSNAISGSVGEVISSPPSHGVNCSNVVSGDMGANPRSTIPSQTRVDGLPSNNEVPAGNMNSKTQSTIHNQSSVNGQPAYTSGIPVGAGDISTVPTTTSLHNGELTSPPSYSNGVSAVAGDISNMYTTIHSQNDVTSLPAYSNGVSVDINANTQTTIHSQCGVNSLPTSNGVPGAKYKTNTGCSAILNGYGRNNVLHGEVEVYPSNDQTFMSDKQYWLKSETRAADIPGTLCSSMSGDGAGDDMTPRDAKVIQLKQNVQSKLAILKKLCANH